MKSPTSLISIRNAVGAMLALSAIFAVVISTISMPGDGASAQVADAATDVDKRAKAWFNSLTLDEAIDALLGKGADAVADVSDDDTTTGRQYFDTDDKATDTEHIDQNIEIIATAWETKTATKTFYDGLPADSTAAGTPPYDVDANPVTQAIVNARVDGHAGSNGGFEGDIYAVGEQVVSDDQAIRGFQSVELWWDHLTCIEARIAVGEDSDNLTRDTDDDTIGNQAEASDVCTYGSATPTNDAALATISYGSLSADAKTQVDEVGQAILGLSSAGSASSADNARAKAWWDSLSGTNERVYALYGSNVTAGTKPDRPSTTATDVDAPTLYLATREYDDITAGISYAATTGQDPLPAKTFPLNTVSGTRATAVKELVNDRWQWIYDMGGMNDDNKAELVYWWDSIGTAQKRIAVGLDNEPTTSTDASEYGVKWDELNPLTNGAGTSADTKAREEKVFEVGQAILGQTVLPQVGAWWNTLSPDQMVYVVYGNPPMRTAYHVDDDGDNDPNDITDDDGVVGTDTPVTIVTDDDKKVFQKSYAELSDDDGIRVAANDTNLNTHLPAYVATMLGSTRNGLNVTTPTAGPDGDDQNQLPDYYYYSAKAIVDAIANEIFDAPTPIMAWVRGTALYDTSAETGGSAVSITDDNDFDWPYNSANKPANVADWWETTDCRTMRLAVGEDNNYLNGAVAAAGNTPAKKAETSIYCGHFPGHDNNAENDLSEEAQKRVVVVGKALLGLTADSNGLHAGRPSFNVAVTGIPTITGTAQVGSTLTAHTDAIGDGDGLGDWNYQWLRSGTDIAGATGSTYTLTAADANAMISVRVSFTDGERYPESTTSVGTSVVAGSPGMILRVEPNIRGIAISGGDTVVLSVNVYGLQDKMDNKLGGTYTWSVNGTGVDGSGRELSYTAPTSPGTYNVKATLADGDCAPKDETMRASACSAEFEVKVLRPSAPQPAPEAPVNPPGEIPSILADSEGEQYEVFTPVEGGKFEGNGYSITAAAGAVSNGEFIGVRMSDDGAASNAGMTHQRYTLGGNMYGVHAVDSTGAAISSYVLEDAATVCVPLPDELRSNISDLAVVAINGDGSLTILSAQVRITTAGTMVCGGLSNLPASVAVGSAGAPAAIPTPTPEPTPEPPVTGGTAPASSATVLWALLLGVAVLTLGAALVIARRREGTRRS